MKLFSLRVFLQEMCTHNLRQREQGIEMCKASLFGDYWESISQNHVKQNLKEMQFVLSVKLTQSLTTNQPLPLEVLPARLQ